MRKPMNRRMFLRGAGGAVMAIPFLPSLTTRAFAADPCLPPVGKCFFATRTEHGGVWGKNLYPDSALLTQQLDYAGRQVRYGNLPAAVDEQGKVVFSPMCTASGAVLTPALVKKFNILRGVDFPYRLGHNHGASLGAFGDSGLNSLTGGISNAAYRTATIDQFMAYSPSFYSEADLSSKMTQRSFCVGGGILSWNFTSPSTKTGDVVSLPHQTANLLLYNSLFDPGSNYAGVDMVIVDHIKEGFDLLIKDPRLSKGDMMRLEQHVERMADIERMLSVIPKLANIPPKPEGDSGLISGWKFFGGGSDQSPVQNANYCHLMNDVIVAAFSTGVSRIATWSQGIKFIEQIVKDWHGNVGHQGLGVDLSQKWALAWNQGTFEHVMVDLASKLDGVCMSDGKTLLDHSLLMMTSESGQMTHHSGCVNYPVVMAGGGGGFFKTGMFVDYCDQTIVYADLDKVIKDVPMVEAESPGLYYQQFLANALMAMGVPASEWENFTEFTAGGPGKSTPTKGYGFHYVDPKKAKDYTKAKLVMGDKLPVITA